MVRTAALLFIPRASIFLSAQEVKRRQDVHAAEAKAAEAKRLADEEHARRNRVSRRMASLVVLAHVLTRSSIF